MDGDSDDEGPAGGFDMGGFGDDDDEADMMPGTPMSTGADNACLYVA